MKKPPAAHGVTLVEAARVLSKLERRPISPSQVRSILVLGTTARAMQPRRQGATRSYSAYDLAEARLNLRLRAEGVSPTVARVIVANLRESLIAHWTTGDPMALAVVGLRGLLVYAAKTRPPHVAAWVDLREVWRGITAAMQATRRAEPDIWCWKWAPASAQTADPMEAL